MKVKDLVIKLVIYVLLVVTIFTFVINVQVIHGNNMHPKVEDGDLVIADRIDKPGLEDVVIYKHDGKTDIGRIVAKGGDTVQITEDGRLLINGTERSEEVYYETTQGKYGTKEINIDSGKYFILNDFRSNTEDSREYGEIEGKDIKGVLMYVIRRRGI